MDKFEEYKFFAENTHHLSERRQAATQTYLTVNTAIFGVIAFLIKDANIGEWELSIALMPLFIVGMLACFIWNKIIIQHKKLINWRYDQLMEIEKDPKMKGSHQFYLKERDEFFKPLQGREKLGFSALEKLLPVLFMVLYACGIIDTLAIAIL